MDLTEFVTQMPLACPSSPVRNAIAGKLIHKDGNGRIVDEWQIPTGEPITIGRDRSNCRHVIDDPCVSRNHLRIYSIIYESDDYSEVEALVYAEDLSTNGTYWNGSFIGRGKGGFLLSDKDVLKLNSRHVLVFESCGHGENEVRFDLTQEKEMARFVKQFIVTDRLLGAGAFGRVFMAIELCHRSQIACKVIDLRKLRSISALRIGRAEQPAAAEDVDSRVQAWKLDMWVEKQKKDNTLERKLEKYYREIEILSSISHPNIVGVEKVFVTDNTIYIFQELVTAGDLFSYIEAKNGEIQEVEAAVILRQILVALCYLHERNIVHRDLKPENVLMTSLSVGCRVVLTDFGTARRISNARHRMCTSVGTVEYAAPETIQHQSRTGYTKSVDMWALGCLAVVLLTGGSAFRDPTTNCYSAALARECNLKYLHNSAEWKQIRVRPKQFIERLLTLNEANRMTAHQAIEHAWFSNEMHKLNFQQQYSRAIKHWQPRQVQHPIIEFVDSYTVKYLPCSQAISNEHTVASRHNRIPIEPPYRPFPRKVHQLLWPRRSVSELVLNDEAKTAMKKWSNLVDQKKMTNQKVCQDSIKEDSVVKPIANPSSERFSKNNEILSESPLNIPIPSTVKHKPQLLRRRTLQPTIPQKRRHGSIFDLAEEYGSNKQTKLAEKQPVYQFDDSIIDIYRDRDGNGIDDREITLPHHSSILVD